MVDTQAIKERYNLVDYVSRYTALRKCTAQEYCGPCPLPGCTSDTDGFHVNMAGWWTCYSCNPEHHSDIVNFVMRYEGVDFLEASRRLDANAVTAPAQPKQPTQAPSDREAKNYQPWMAQMRRELDTTRGANGRRYLLSRGFAPETWQAFGAGYGLWDSKKYRADKRNGQFAVTMPWYQGRDVPFIKFRFMDSDPNDKQRSCGTALLFGLHLLTDADVLFIVEGEMNAMSIWQALRGLDRAADVVSVGNKKTKRCYEAAATLAKEYRHVIVWLDDEVNSRELMQMMGTSYGLQSPNPDSAKKGKDANDLLQQGLLADFLSLAFDEFGIGKAPPEVIDYSAPDELRPVVEAALSGDRAAIAQLVAAWCRPLGVGVLDKPMITVRWPAHSDPVCCEQWESQDDNSIVATYSRPALVWALSAMYCSPAWLQRLAGKYEPPKVRDLATGYLIPACIERPYLSDSLDWLVRGLDAEALTWQPDLAA